MYGRRPIRRWYAFQAEEGEAMKEALLCCGECSRDLNIAQLRGMRSEKGNTRNILVEFCVNVKGTQIGSRARDQREECEPRSRDSGMELEGTKSIGVWCQDRDDMWREAHIGVILLRVYRWKREVLLYR